MQQSRNAGESFSFDEDSRRTRQILARKTAHQQVKRLQEKLILINAVRLQAIDGDVDTTAVLTETSTQDYELNEEINSRFPSAIRTKQTLYETLVYALLSHLYNNSTERKRTKLLELKTIVYTDELEDMCAGIDQIPKKYKPEPVFNNASLKEIMAKCFKMIETQLTGKSHIEDSQTAVYQVLTRHPVCIFALSLMLRKLVKKLSLLYEMQIEDFSIYQMNTDPQLDILWLVCEFFEVNIVLYQLDGKIIKEQKFKVNDQEPISLVRNDESSTDWTYLCLRDHRIRQISEIHPEEKQLNQKFWKTNSSASELKFITYFDKKNQESTPELKTKRKVPKRVSQKRHEKTNQLRQQFNYEYRAITAETEYIFSKAESVLLKLQRIVGDNPPKDYSIVKTVEVRVIKGSSS